MERTIDGVFITSGIIFMIGCIWSMILDMVTKYGSQSLNKRRLIGRKRLLSLTAHQNGVRLKEPQHPMN